MPKVRDGHFSQNVSMTSHCYPPPSMYTAKTIWGLLLPLSWEIPRMKFQRSSKEFSQNHDDKMKALLLTLQLSSYKTFYFFKTFSFWCPAGNPTHPKDYELGPIIKKCTRVAEKSRFKKANTNTYIGSSLFFLFFKYIGNNGFMWRIPAPLILGVGIWASQNITQTGDYKRWQDKSYFSL